MPVRSRPPDDVSGSRSLSKTGLVLRFKFICYFVRLGRARDYKRDEAFKDLGIAGFGLKVVLVGAHRP